MGTETVAGAGDTGDAGRTAKSAGDAEGFAGAAERRREQRGWYFYDWAVSVFSTSVLTVFLGPYLTSVAEAAADGAGYVHPLGIPVRAGAYFAYAVSVSVLLSVLVMPLAGAIADRSGRKKPIMGVFAYLGAAATTGMFFLEGDRYLLGGALLVVANVSYATAVVVYNSFLPQIATPGERDAVSSRGWAFGYASGSLVLVANLALFLGHESLGVSEGTAVRICLASAGLWWAVFAIIPLRRLRERPAAHTPAGAAPGGGVSLRGGWRQLAGTLRDLRRYPLTLMFLLAYLLYNDGVQTVITQASVFGAGELGMDQTTLIGAILLVQVLAVAGALLLGRLAVRYGAKRTILGSLVAWTATVGAGYVLPAGEPVWFFVLAAAIGMVLGGTQALSRSLYAQLVPPGKEAEYFSLYEVSDRGTSWLGPLVFGLTYQLTGSYRDAIISLVIFFVLGFILLLRVPVRRAVAAVGAAAPDRI
ncbi:MFS transporter [Streptomyces radiopugnans]|uniref:MFS transporter, UMF1 family n=1 Tax=Streptomyces radiopugnans TaxID=403935 RepID=A0A1H9BJC5_9ACTN|nr:MFS transporter [Streptomyces radiopugnans]SEP88817.1 MFS transporter, UMF1 family [Streptomyces radiopugnans]